MRFLIRFDGASWFILDRTTNRRVVENLSKHTAEYTANAFEAQAFWRLM